MKDTVKALNNLTYDSLGKVQNIISKYIGVNCKIRENDKVAVKLNLVGPYEPDKAATTHPEVVCSLIEALLPYKCSIMLCEDIENEETLVKTGMKAVLDKYCLNFYNLRDFGYESISQDGTIYSYSSLIKHCDILIDIPKYKTHMFAYFTGAIKNMYGCISKKQRKELHKDVKNDQFAKHIYSIYSIRTPDLIITDAIVAMEGLGPSIGNPKYLGYLVLCQDGVEADCYLSNLVGYTVGDLPILQFATEGRKGVSSSDWGPDTAKRVTDFKRMPVYKGKLREKYLDILRRSYQVDRDLCIQCGECARNCPFEAIEFDGYPRFLRERCALCICCMELCPVNAINYKK
ncbi:MAG: DUF362 domain-containing protein [Clostridia bacterium]|nr:DUF362 domain-containing protein [Clostridia bacterium]